MSTATTSPESTKSRAKKYIRRSEAQWRELVEEFDRSGLSLEAYCKHNRIAPSGFYTWRKRFKSQATAADPAEAFIDITSELNTHSSAQLSPADTWQVELEPGAGCILRIKTV